MINIPNFSGDVSLQRYSVVEGRIKQFNDYEVIGKDQSGLYNMYIIKLGNPNKPTLLITAGMHGTEWQGSQFSLGFMEMIENNTFPDPEFRNYLLDNFYVIYMPVMNPWGYDRTTPTESKTRNRGRRNSLDVDMNHDFGVKSQAETINTISVMKRFKPFAYLDLHLQTYDMSNNQGNNFIVGNGQSQTDYVKERWIESLRNYVGEPVTNWQGYTNLSSGLSRRYMRDQDNPNTPYTLSYIVEMTRAEERNGVLREPLSTSEIYKYGCANIYLFFVTSIEYFNEVGKESNGIEMDGHVYKIEMPHKTVEFERDSQGTVRKVKESYSDKVIESEIERSSNGEVQSINRKQVR